MHEGRIYVLTNFKVKDYLGDETYRAVRNQKHIYFTAHTKIEKDVDFCLPIERNAFDLFYMGELENLAKDNRFLVGKLSTDLVVNFFATNVIDYLIHCPYRCCR